MEILHRDNSTLKKYRLSILTNYPYNQEDLGSDEIDWLIRTEEQYNAGYTNRTYMNNIAEEHSRGVYRF